MNRYDWVEPAIRDRVIAARRAAGLSQEALGDALGLSKPGYGHYERGAVALGVLLVALLALTLPLILADLLSPVNDLRDWGGGHPAVVLVLVWPVVLNE